MFELMYTMRRMEITCDNEYKARNIRGFCHLYDGQEAVATGIQYALSAEDSWITSYRCHCIALARGGNVASIVGELFGVVDGMSKGKGGSMHFYSKKGNFYGGQGIVGAQVPVGTGLAFANKYKAKPGEPMNVAIGCYGDGAANQGQIWEAANMASLWKLVGASFFLLFRRLLLEKGVRMFSRNLTCSPCRPAPAPAHTHTQPMIFCIENNQYGMGTSIDRHSSISDYYKMGNAIPGLRIDGMNALAVREGMRFAKEFCGSGQGPMYIEMMTYRYHGHSMSDPGTTYRNREEIAFTRSTRDPLEFIKKTLVETGYADEAEIKEAEKRIRKEVQAEVMKAKESPRPPLDSLIDHIFAETLEPQGPWERPTHIRMPDYTKSYWADGKME
jgi:pyruvate dehydrogenase E1 component alpha subunit